MNACVCGLGWGDEGKGKVVDFLCGDYDYVIRYNGGANAGHTVVLDGRKYGFHHLPSGVLRGKIGVLAAGMVINPPVLLDELEMLPGEPELVISNKAHVVMPWHIAADIRRGGKIGTTRRGIGPCYAEKMHRWHAIRMGDLLERVEDERSSRFFTVDEVMYGSTLWRKYRDAASRLKKYVAGTESLLRSALQQGANLLFESANGIHLDVDHGDYPFVTSSAVGPAAIPQACALPNLHLDRIVGVIKCYATRVGEGPFPSEFDGPTATRIREKGKEFGTTTGRPRRIGWFDVAKTQEAVALTGATEIALMHVDTFAGLETVQLHAADGPITLPGWKDHRDDDFGRFVSVIEDHAGIPVRLVGHGPERVDMMVRS